MIEPKLFYLPAFPLLAILFWAYYRVKDRASFWYLPRIPQTYLFAAAIPILAVMLLTSMLGGQ